MVMLKFEDFINFETLNSRPKCGINTIRLKYNMKTKFFLLIIILLPSLLMAQENNKNTLTVKVNDTIIEAQPRKVAIGRAVCFTGNVAKPETMLRIWIADFDKGTRFESGNYLVINAETPPGKKEMKDGNYIEKYKGIAAIRYVLETKPPRMTYHVGDSQNNDETLTVVNNGDGYIEITFDNIVLEGSHWKEKNFATAVGGLGRLQDKMASKVISKTTGFDWNIDPEGNGYRNLDEPDEIKLTEGKMVVKLNDTE